MRSRRRSTRRLVVDGIAVSEQWLWIAPEPWSWIE